MGLVLSYIMIGVLSGVLAGFFGIGGGIIIAPLLISLLGFSAQQAAGTSLAVLLPPVGAAAVFQYYKSGFVNFKAAIFIAIFMFIASYFSAGISTRLAGGNLRLYLGVFLVLIGLYTIYGSLSKIK